MLEAEQERLVAEALAWDTICKKGGSNDAIILALIAKVRELMANNQRLLNFCKRRLIEINGNEYVDEGDNPDAEMARLQMLLMQCGVKWWEVKKEATDV